MPISSALKLSNNLPKLTQKLGSSAETAKTVGKALQHLETFAIDPAYDALHSFEKAVSSNASQHFQAMVRGEAMPSMIKAQENFATLIQTEEMQEATENLAHITGDLTKVLSSDMAMSAFLTAMNWFNKLVELAEKFKAMDKTKLFEAFFHSVGGVQ